MLRKVSGWPKQDTAVGFYRVVQPVRELKRAGLAEDARILPFSGDLSMQKMDFNDRTFMDVCEGSDAFFTTLVYDDAELLKVLNLRKHYGFKWIVDVDDNLYAVSRDNPAYGVSVAVRDRFERCVSLADGVTVSVPALKEALSHLNGNVFVQKNGIDFPMWPKNGKHGTGKVRIGWEGASGHKDDLELVYPALKKIAEDYPQVELVAFGHRPERLAWEWHDWVGFLDDDGSCLYARKLASLNLDVIVAPLLDTAYNRCKSNLRLLDAAALSIPAVYSPTVNYRGFPGLTAETSREWYAQLSSLVSDPSHRLALGKNARKFAEANYAMPKLVAPLAAWLEDLPLRDDY